LFLGDVTDSLKSVSRPRESSVRETDVGFFCHERPVREPGDL